MMVERIKFLYSTDNTIGQGSDRFGTKHSLEYSAEMAKKSGMNGIEIIPTKATLGEMNGLLDTEVVRRIGAAALHAREEKTVMDVVRAAYVHRENPAEVKKILGSFVIFPETGESVAALKALQTRSLHTLQRDIPVALPSIELLQQAKGLRKKTLIVNPEICQQLNVCSLEELGPKVEELGFDGGICVEPSQLKSKGTDGKQTALADLETSLPAMWQDVGLVKINLGSDLPGNVNPFQKLHNLYTNSGEEPFKTLKILYSQYEQTDNHPPIVFRTPYSAARKVAGKTFMSGKDLVNFNFTLLVNAKMAMGYSKS